MGFVCRDIYDLSMGQKKLSISISRAIDASKRLDFFDQQIPKTPMHTIGLV